MTRRPLDARSRARQIERQIRCDADLRRLEQRHPGPGVCADPEVTGRTLGGVDLAHGTSIGVTMWRPPPRCRQCGSDSLARRPTLAGFVCDACNGQTLPAPAPPKRDVIEGRIYCGELLDVGGAGPESLGIDDSG